MSPSQSSWPGPMRTVQDLVAEGVGFGSRPGSEKRRERDRELRDGFSVGADRRNETGLKDANASTERSGSPPRRGLRGSVAVVREEGIRLRH